ncbi:hypothetical protein [Aestuariispira insulae]|uniref:Uncharacterized protein n=1 Tax=Aestuariispira insulae TaxID=1461337 RepID=A0A3D9HPR6_9PROT|nr:hypothetical protein [Aestuariispira insulae]RED51395.1 hypothetical protein DFP90_103195 [Aestuariispira insulae]
MAENLKPIILALVGVIVILGYAGLMMFGFESLVWAGLVLSGVVSVQIGIWSFSKL